MNQKKRFQLCFVFYVSAQQLRYTGDSSDKAGLYIRAVAGHNPTSGVDTEHLSTIKGEQSRPDRPVHPIGHGVS
eukprot:12914485-Prorocentrum_lima.AAC.1